MRKRLLTLAMVMSVALFATACGDDESGDAVKTTKENSENAGNTDSSDEISKDDSKDDSNGASDEETTEANVEEEEYVDTIENDEYGIAQYIKDTYPDADIKFKKEMILEKKDIAGENVQILDTNLSFTMSDEWQFKGSMDTEDWVRYRYNPDERNLMNEHMDIIITARYDRQECTEEQYIECIQNSIADYVEYGALHDKVSVYKVNINGYEGYGIESFPSKDDGKKELFLMYIDGHIYSVSLGEYISKLLCVPDELYNEVFESALSVISTMSVE